MQAISKFNGVWYGLGLTEGEAFDVPPALEAKVTARSDMFDVEAEDKSDDDDAPVKRKPGRPRVHAR